MRKNAREAAFKFVFAETFGSDVDGRFESDLYKKEELSEEDRAFAHKLILLVREHKNDFQAILDEKVKTVPEARIFPVDRAVLFIALAEIMYLDDIPAVVSVNEAVGLVRKYSTESSAGFVNGVLAGVINS